MNIVFRLILNVDYDKEIKLNDFGEKIGFSKIFDFVGGFRPLPSRLGFWQIFAGFLAITIFFKQKISGFFGCIVTYKNRGNF